MTTPEATLDVIDGMIAVLRDKLRDFVSLGLVPSDLAVTYTRGQVQALESVRTALASMYAMGVDS